MGLLFLLWLFARESCRPWFGIMTYCTKHGSVCSCPHGFSLASKGSKGDVILLSACVPLTGEPSHMMNRLGIKSLGEYSSLALSGSSVRGGRPWMTAFLLAQLLGQLCVRSIEAKVPRFFLGLPGMQEGRSSLSLPAASSAWHQGTPGLMVQYLPGAHKDSSYGFMALRLLKPAGQVYPC